MSKYAELFKGKPPGGAGGESPALRTGEAAKSSEAFTLLFVDDEANVLKALTRIFLEENYNILTAMDAEKALKTLATGQVHLVISDHRMPGMSGAELLKAVKEKWPETIRIMLTGHADIHSIMGAVNEGAVYKFITKPWNDEDLRLTVSLALQQYVLLRENKQLKELTRKQEEKIKKFANRLGENRSILGNILVKAGFLTQTQLATVQRTKKREELLGDALVRLKVVTEGDIVNALQKQLHLEYIDLKEANINPAVAKFLPKDICERNLLIPLHVDGKQIHIAMADPSDIFKADNISFMTGLQVVPFIARGSDIMEQLRQVYDCSRLKDGSISVEGLADFEPIDEIDLVIEEEKEDVDLQELVGESQVPPIVRIVNAIISEAIRYGASDIHLEPKTKYVVVRYRIDGMLHSKIRIPLELHPATISRVKILAKMDISERRVPQDGRISVKTGTRMVDIRVSTMPTINGEKVVMRILDKSSSIKKMEELGVLEEDLAKIETLIKKPQGMLICTGPTGSGKTTLLYSILSAMLMDSKNYQTIEDPVEYFLDEANQVFVKDKIGLSFASVLRATLRQDPDVLLVGEMRDIDTADVAFKAALTGHMVLTTLHTNNSVASVTRLMDIGTKPYMIASALEGIIAQRLVRKLCRHCRKETAPPANLMQVLNLPPASIGETIYQAEGCDQCGHTGYQGRLGVFELFLMNDDFRHFIGSSSYKESKLLEMARAGGMHTLIEDGVRKVKQGLTTLEELLRVIGPQTRYERVCENCHQQIEMKFLYCPFCGKVRKNFCIECMRNLEEEWLVCPSCGKKKSTVQNN